MAHFEEVCAYCTYLNPNLRSMNKGKFKCTRDNKYRFADIEVCSNFCEIFWYKSDASLEAYNASKRYREAGCHITTAIVNILELPNCQELAILKDFRVRNMENNPKYADMLTKYDKLGPIVADSLIKENDMGFAWELFSTYIKKTVELVVNGNLRASLGMQENGYYDAALELYISMTKKLIKKYIPDYPLPQEEQKDNSDTANESSFKLMPKEA